MLAIFGIGTGELLVILLIILVLFGATRIPAVMGGLGRGLREFKKGLSGSEEAKEGHGQSLVPVEELKARIGKHVRLLPDGTLEVGGAEGATMVEVDASGLVVKEGEGITRIPLHVVKRVVHVN